MDPFTLMMGAGLLMSAVGTGGSMFGASKSAQLSQQQAAYEQQIQQQKHQQMVLETQRSQMENIRNSQLARSMALNSATGQGAQFGTGLQGGYGQISGQAGTNRVNLQQNEEIGQNIFDLNSQISGVKYQQADNQASQAMWSGVSSFGGQLMAGATKFGQLTASNGQQAVSGGLQRYMNNPAYSNTGGYY